MLQTSAGSSLKRCVASSLQAQNRAEVNSSQSHRGGSRPSCAHTCVCLQARACAAMATLQERPEAPEGSVPPRRTGRAISFAGQIRAPSLEDDSDAVDSPRVGAGRKLSHTGSIQVRMAVAPMAQRKTRAPRPCGESLQHACSHASGCVVWRALIGPCQRSPRTPSTLHRALCTQTPRATTAEWTRRRTSGAPSTRSTRLRRLASCMVAHHDHSQVPTHLRVPHTALFCNDQRRMV